MIFCTLTDKNYLHKGLTLYRNLEQKTYGQFVLHYLCLDDETYDKLEALKLQNLCLWKISNLEENFAAFKNLRNLPACQYGDAHSMFCWACAPVFINHLLKILRPESDLLYVDSDIYFYENPSKIFDFVRKSGAPVGLHRHRFTSPYEPLTNPVGEYNVGVVYFKANDAGKEISDFWAYLLVDPKNEYYSVYGSCGDQKYLDLFIPRFGEEKICIFDKDSGIGHGAPWNFDSYTYTFGGIVNHEKQEEQIIFNHFSHFTYNLPENRWSSSLHGEWAPEKINPAVESYYKWYFEEIKCSAQLLNI